MLSSFCCYRFDCLTKLSLSTGLLVKNTENDFLSIVIVLEKQLIIFVAIPRASSSVRSSNLKSVKSDLASGFAKSLQLLRICSVLAGAFIILY